LTASNFGAVIKRRTSIPPHNLLKKILYSKNVETPAINYGKTNEKLVFDLFQEK